MTVLSLLSRVAELWSYKMKEIAHSVLKLTTLVFNTESMQREMLLFQHYGYLRLSTKFLYVFTFAAFSQCFSWLLLNGRIRSQSLVFPHRVNFSGLHRITLPGGVCFSGIFFVLLVVHVTITVSVDLIMKSLEVSCARLVTWIFL